jgi:hypothetical protein
LSAAFWVKQRVIMVPPGIEQGRLAYLRAAVRDILLDPRIAADFESKGQPVHYGSPEGISSLIGGLFGDKITPERLLQIRRVVLDEFY